MSVEHRKQQRHKVKFDAIIYTPEISLMALVTDISGNGLRLQVAKIVHPGTKIDIAIQLKDEIVFRGNVMWTLDVLVEQLSVYDIGVCTDFIIFNGKNISANSEKLKLVANILPSLSS